MCCCVGLGVTNRPFKKMPACWRVFVVGDMALNFNYKIPKTGYYALSVAAKDTTEQEAHNAKNWLSFYVGHYRKNSVLDVGKWLREALSKEENADRLPENPSVLIRWIGKDVDFVPAKSVSVEELRTVDKGSFTQCNIFPDGTDVFELNDNRVIAPPKGNWAKFPANTAHWYIQNVRLTKLGTYTLYVVGDDEQRVMVGGKPVVWTNAPYYDGKAQDCSRQRSQGTFNITKEGDWQFIIMQVNVPAGTPTWTSLVLKDPDGEVVPMPVVNWQAMMTAYDCDNDPIIPTETDLLVSGGSTSEVEGGNAPNVGRPEKPFTFATSRNG